MDRGYICVVKCYALKPCIEYEFLAEDYIQSVYLILSPLVRYGLHDCAVKKLVVCLSVCLSACSFVCSGTTLLCCLLFAKLLVQESQLRLRAAENIKVKCRALRSTNLNDCYLRGGMLNPVDLIGPLIDRSINLTVKLILLN